MNHGRMLVQNVNSGGDMPEIREVVEAASKPWYCDF